MFTRTSGTTTARHPARRRRARGLLYLWGLSIVLGLLQPCCEVFAAAESAPAMAAPHDCGGTAPAGGNDQVPAAADCDPGDHAGSADGPPTDAGDARVAHTGGAIALPAALPLPGPAPRLSAWRARGSP
ncbi:MAG: hypothetical protein RLW62_09950, partial [Gammaproteobacteria bacterium]